MSETETLAGVGDHSICECVKCGRMHRRLGSPPWALTRNDLMLLSRTVGRHMDLNINQPGYRINEWLKRLLTSENIDNG